jgi:hypothetical protein
MAAGKGVLGTTTAQVFTFSEQSRRVDKRSASTFVAGGMVDALRLSTLRMSKAEGLSYLFDSGLYGLGMR